MGGLRVVIDKIQLGRVREGAGETCRFLQLFHHTSLIVAVKKPADCRHIQGLLCLAVQWFYLILLSQKRLVRLIYSVPPAPVPLVHRHVE